MVSLVIEITITGMDELIQKVGNTPELLGEPLRNFFNHSTMTLQRNAQMLTPVDTGRLRASETTEIDSSPIPLWGRTGTNVYYGIFVEEDTIPHWPPVNALRGWATRHGMNPFLLARAISRRGTKGKHMFSQSLASNKENISNFLQNAAYEIETKWGSK